MAKLILKYEAAVLKEIPLAKPILTIGRTPGNDVVIDNPAVSGQHARILVEQNQVVLEDMNSLNGTFVNSQRIRKSTLKDGDEILIGKHTVQFRGEGAALPKPAAPAEKTQAINPFAEETVVLDTKKRREMLAQEQASASSGATQAATAPAAQDKVGTLAVISGKTDQREYVLTGKLSVIGKDAMASVKLKRWFAPKVAAIINRKEGRYNISPSDKAGAAKVNSQPLTAPRELQDGDMIEVSGVRMQFSSGLSALRRSPDRTAAVTFLSSPV